MPGTPAVFIVWPVPAAVCTLDLTAMKLAETADTG